MLRSGSKLQLCLDTWRVCDDRDTREIPEQIKKVCDRS